MSEHAFSESATEVVERMQFGREAAVPIFGLVRVVSGVSMVAVPTIIATAMGFREKDARRLRWLLRAQGVRDVALGLGTLRAWVYDEPVSGWVAALAATKIADAATFAIAGTKGDIGTARGWALAAGATAGAALETYTAIALSQEPNEHDDWHELGRLEVVSDFAEAVPFTAR